MREREAGATDVPSELELGGVDPGGPAMDAGDAAADAAPGSENEGPPRRRERKWYLPPLYERELRQTLRGTGVPVSWVAFLLLASLSTAALGAGIAAFTEPERAGALLFQIFFSAAYFLIALLGTAVGAAAMASERDAQTWDALILTPLSPRTIVRDKMAASFSRVAIFVVPLLPVSALLSVIGDVTATELVLAELDLLLLSFLSVAFGTMVGSRMQSATTAVVLALAGAGIASPGAYFGAFGLSFAAHDAWPEVPRFAPAWFPIAQAVVPIGGPYLVLLWLLPLSIAGIAGWFFYESAVAGIADPADDRTQGLRSWFAIGMPVAAVCAFALVASADPPSRFARLIDGMGSLTSLMVFGAVVLSIEPRRPSARTLLRQERLGWRPLRHAALAPGIVRSAMLQLAVGLAGLGVLAGAGTLLVGAAERGSPPHVLAGVLAGALLPAQIWAGFFVFTVGLGAWFSSTLEEPLAIRICLLGSLAAACLIPILLRGPLAIFLGMDSGGAPWMGDAGGASRASWAPLLSPFMAGQLGGMVATGHRGPFALVGFAAAAAWAAGGIAFLWLAVRRTRGPEVATAAAAPVTPAALETGEETPR